MKDKGIDELLSAARELSVSRPDIEFRIIGFSMGIMRRL